nr:type VI secretion system-associated FHA domain protein [uncultured Rhodopila sp.]
MAAELTLTMIKHPPGVRPDSRQADGPEFWLGRGEANGEGVDWALPDSTKTISRKHCIVLREGDGWSVIDKSSNGTFVNQDADRLPPDVPRPLRNCDRLRIGHYVFQVEIRRERALAPEPQPPPGGLYDRDMPPTGWPGSVSAEDAPGPVAAGDALGPLLEGARLPHARVQQPDQALRQAGAALRALVAGLREIEAAQQTIRSGFRVRNSYAGRNPVANAPTDQAALEAILSAEGAGAVQAMLSRTAHHELATISAMRSAIRALLQSLSPELLQQAAEQIGGLSVLGTQRKARAWEAYEARYSEVRNALEDDFDRAFGKSFADAYEQALQAGTRDEWS